MYTVQLYILYLLSVSLFNSNHDYLNCITCIVYMYTYVISHVLDRPEDELVELLWRDGQVVLQSQVRRESSVQVQTHKHDQTLRKPNQTYLENQETIRKLNENVQGDQETVSWIQYPPEDVVDPFESEFSSHFFSSIDHLDGQNHPKKPPAIKETAKPEAKAMAPPKFRPPVVSVGPSHCGSNQSTNDHQVTHPPVSISDRSKNVEERLDTSSGGSSGCSKETESGRSVTISRKRKHAMDTDQESMSQSDVRLMSADDQAMGNKSSQRSGSTRRSRAAEVHNLSERVCTFYITYLIILCYSKNSTNLKVKFLFKDLNVVFCDLWFIIEEERSDQ